MLNKFFRPKLIVGSLPVTLTNGTTADATQVMSDLNWIVNQINANAAPINNPTFTGIINAAAANFTNITASGTLAVTGTITPGQTTGIVGTTTNNNAQAGSIGESLYSVASLGNITTSVTYQDIASIVLTAGDWDISGQMTFYANASPITAGQMGISPNAGNSATGLVAGDNLVHALPPTAGVPSTITIANYRVSIAAGATYYLKAYATFGSGNPQAEGKISARRVR